MADSQVPCQADSNYRFHINSFYLLVWKKTAGVHKSVGIGMFCWNGNVKCPHYHAVEIWQFGFSSWFTLSILSEFVSASYTLSVRRTHCASKHSMRSLSHWISLVPSSKSFPHMAQWYSAVFVVLKAMKLVRSTCKWATRWIRLLVCSSALRPALAAKKGHHMHCISLNFVYLKYTDYILLLFLTRSLQFLY